MASKVAPAILARGPRFTVYLEDGSIRGIAQAGASPARDALTRSLRAPLRRTRFAGEISRSRAVLIRGRYRKTIPLTVTVIALMLVLSLRAAPAQSTDNDEVIRPAVVSELFTDDLPAIRERGVLRALVSYSRTDFFLEGARPRGVMPELLRVLEKHLNKGRKRRELHTQVHYVIVPFDRLLPALLAGEGDVAAAFLTETPERAKLVDFTRGTEGWVNEVLVTHKDVGDVSSVDDLAGRVVYVLRGSSYAEHLRRLNRELEDAGKAPIDIREADRYLATEDLLELVNAGVMEMTVSDDFRADLWAKVLPDIVVRHDMKINEGGTVGWAVRKNNPELLATLKAAGSTVRRGTAIGNILMKRYFKSTRWIKNPISESERKRLRTVADLFERYGEQYGFDWLAILAQAYQESGLDHTAKSPVGAVGIMQLLPSTARDPNVGVPNIEELENNIHAGAKYDAFLRERYFSEPGLAEADRLAFTWAAYNAGPARVRSMRRKTEKMGLDPNRWFGNVELAALAIVGQETVRYVSNIYKYYIAYKTVAAMHEIRKARKTSPEKSD
jgi:membrane-bound lytic murein transglycosylase MltF